MKRFAFLSVVLLSIGCFSKSGGKVDQLTPTQAYGLLSNHFAVLVDVREESEVADGMAEPAQWMPMSKVNEDPAAWKTFVETLPKDKQIIFYCARGGRAGKVAEKLAAEGFKTANAGGFGDWVDAGLPTKKP